MQYNDLKNENIIVELKTLIENADSVKDELDSYCEFMKGVILNTSGIN